MINVETSNYTEEVRNRQYRKTLKKSLEKIYGHYSSNYPLNELI